MRSLLLVCLLFAAFAAVAAIGSSSFMDAVKDQKAALSGAMRKINAKRAGLEVMAMTKKIVGIHKELHTRHVAPFFPQSAGKTQVKLQAVSAGCITALSNSALLVNLNSCDSQFNSLSPSNVEATINTMCSAGGCMASLNEYITGIKDACSDADLIELFGNSTDPLAAQLDEVIKLVELVCFKEGDTFCFPKFLALGTKFSGFASEAVFTDDTLNELCGPCIRKFVVKLQEFAPADTSNSMAALEMVCFKDPGTGKYCLPEIQQIIADISAGESGSIDQTRAIFVRICSTSCFRMIFNALARTADSASERREAEENAKQFEVYCSAHPDGSLCIDVILGSSFIGENSPLQSCPDSDDIIEDQSRTCPADCKSALTQFHSEAGCCLGTFFSEGNPEVLANLTKWSSNQCGLQLGGMCVATAKVTGTIALNNIRASYYEQNQDSVKDKARQDIATNLAVHKDNVAITSATLTTSSVGGSGVQLSQATTGSTLTLGIEVSGANNADVGRMQKQLDTQIKEGSLVFPTLSSDRNVRADPFVGVSADSEKSSVTTVSPAPSLAAFALSFLAAISMMALHWRLRL